MEKYINEPESVKHKENPTKSHTKMQDRAYLLQ